LVAGWIAGFLQHKLSPEAVYDVTWKTITRERDHRRIAKHIRASAEYSQVYQDRLTEATEMAKEEYLSAEHEKRAQVLEWMTRILNSIELMRIGGTSEHGQVGVFPLNAEVGDEICIIAGLCAPLVLRAQLENGVTTSRKIVGECYLHGVMDGEALRHPSWKLTSILIS
jgi:hypothetical protein